MTTLGKLAACSTLERAKARADRETGSYSTAIVTYHSDSDYPYVVWCLAGPGLQPAQHMSRTVVYVAQAPQGQLSLFH